MQSAQMSIADFEKLVEPYRMSWKDWHTTCELQTLKSNEGRSCRQNILLSTKKGDLVIRPVNSRDVIPKNVPLVGWVMKFTSCWGGS